MRPDRLDGNHFVRIALVVATVVLALPVSVQPQPAPPVDTLLAHPLERTRSHPAEALAMAEEALALAQQTGDLNGQARSLRLIGDLHFAHDRLTEALDVLIRAERLFKAIEDREALAGVLNQIGDIHTRRGDLPHALRAHLKALDLCEELGNEEGVAQAFNSIGLIYQRQGDTDKAISYHRRATRLYEALSDHEDLAKTYNNLANAFMDAGAYEDAILSLRRTLALSGETGNPRVTAAALNNIGVAFNRSDRPAEALGYLRRAFRTSEEIGYVHLSAAICDELGRTYLALGNLDLALTFAQRSLVLGEKAEDAYYVHLTHELLSRIHAARGEYEQAYAYHRQYTATRDTLLDAETAAVISRIQTRHEMEDMEQQIQSLHQQSRIQTLQARQRQNLLLGGLGALFLVAGFSFNRYRLKQKANRLLRSKNEEIERQREALHVNLDEKSLMLEEKEMLVKEIHHRVKNNLQVLSSMLRLQIQTLESPHALAALRDMQARVLSMALLHRELYGEDNSTHVDMQRYIEKLSRFLLRAFNADGRIRCPVHARSIQLNADTVMPVGLVLNELLSNALKHAFPDERRGLVQIDLHQTETGWYEMTVSDNGVGVLEEATLETGATVGLTMVRVMTRQLRGTMRQTHGVGLTTTVRFRAKEGRT